MVDKYFVNTFMIGDLGPGIYDLPVSLETRKTVSPEERIAMNFVRDYVSLVGNVLSKVGNPQITYPTPDIEGIKQATLDGGACGALSCGRGMEKSAIANIQNQLASLGYAPNRIDELVPSPMTSGQVVSYLAKAAVVGIPLIFLSFFGGSSGTVQADGGVLNHADQISGEIYADLNALRPVHPNSVVIEDGDSGLAAGEYLALVPDLYRNIVETHGLIDIGIEELWEKYDCLVIVGPDLEQYPVYKDMFLNASDTSEEYDPETHLVTEIYTKDGYFAPGTEVAIYDQNRDHRWVLAVGYNLAGSEISK